MTGISNFDKSLKFPSKAKAVQEFLANNKYKAIDSNTQGISWIELYTLYKLSGGPCMVDNPESKAQAKPMMRQQLKAFVHTARTIARLTMECDDAMPFRFNDCKKTRLKGLGISTHIPMLKCQVAIDSNLRREIAAHIIKSQGRRNPKQMKDILDRRVAIKTQKFVVAKKNKVECKHRC